MNFRSPNITVGLSPIIRRDLRHAVQVNRTLALHVSAPDSRRMVPHAWTCRTASSLNFPIPGEPGLSFRRSCHHQSPPSSRISRDAFGRLTTAKPALTYATRWVAIYCRDQQNAFAICSCNSPLRAATRVSPFGNIESAAVNCFQHDCNCRRLTPATPAIWL
jgi:hypothetical protein